MKDMNFRRLMFGSRSLHAVRWSVLLLGTGLVVGQGASPHAKTNRVAKPSPAATASVVPDPLTSLLANQKVALQSGDPHLIATTTRPLIAQELQQLSELKMLERKPDEAVDLYRKALTANDTSDTRLEFASFLLHLGKFQDAAEQAQLVTVAMPQNAAAWVTQGTALRAAGKEAAAGQAFERALALTPDVSIAYALACTLLAQHQPEKAKRLFAEIVKGTDNAPIWHVAIGDAYRDNRYYDEAVNEFKTAIALDPKALHAEFFLGFTYLQMNEWGPNSQSFEHLRKAVALSPHEYVSNFYLGAIESTDGSDLASSDKHLHAAAEADPAQPETWLYLGQNANREHDVPTAERDLRKCIELTGADEARNNYQVRRAYFALGRLLTSQGKREEGAALLAKYRVEEQAAVRAAGASIAASQDEHPGQTMSGTAPLAALQDLPITTPAVPSRATAPVLSPETAKQVNASEAQLSHLLAGSFQDLGTAEARQQEYSLALGDFREAENWEPPSPALRRNLGVAAFRIGDYATAQRELALVLAEQTKTQKVSLASSEAASLQRTRMMLAVADFSLGHFQAAATEFGAAPEATLADPRAAYSWAYSLMRTGHAQEANRIADRLSAQPLPSDLASLVCHIYVDDEDYKGSLACYQRAYKQDPTLALAHYQAAFSLVRLDRPQEAVAELDQEAKLSPNRPEVEYLKAYALLQASHKDEAQRLFEQLAAAHPEQAQAQYQLGKLLLEEGKTDEAIAHLEMSEKADATPEYVHYQLGTAYRKANRTAEAQREFTIYREAKDRKRDDSAVPVTPPGL